MQSGIKWVGGGGMWSLQQSCVYVRGGGGEVKGGVFWSIRYTWIMGRLEGVEGKK